MKNWFQISNVAEVDSPSLLIYPERVRENVRRMIVIAGGAHRLCPHVKTHKLPQLTQMQLEMGITRFKCSTIAEAEMAAAAGAKSVLLAHQLVEPKLARFIQLTKEFPGTRFSTIVDNAVSALEISALAASVKIQIALLLDLDCGMRRTGIPAGPGALELFRTMASLPGIEVEGLHVYDGHIADSDLSERQRRCDAAFAPVAKLHEDILNAGLPCPRVVAGGTPTFPIHARRKDVECSPGTCVLWDEGYGSRCRDLDFLHAALVLTRVISKPGPNRLCLDLGHKAIAAENPHPRVFFLDLTDAKAVTHSEEHLVIETEKASQFTVGDTLYGIPWHVCPTVALYSEAVVVEKGIADARWEVKARKRRINI